MPLLVGAYTLLCVVVSALGTLLLGIGSSKSGFADILATFLGDALPAGTSGWAAHLEVALRFAASLASAIFLAAIVSKFFLGARIEWRSNVTMTTADGRPVLEVRLRNRGYLPLHEVEGRAYLRVRLVDRGAATATNTKLDVLVAGMPTEFQQWPTMSGGMPLTLRVPISQDTWTALLAGTVGGQVGNAHIPAASDSVSLVVSVRGQASVTGLSISEACTYPIGSSSGTCLIEHGRPASIDYEIRRHGLWRWSPIPSFRYRGARHFDELDAMVFVYGSLMKMDSLMATLERHLIPGFETTELQGWRRAWNCVSAKTFASSSHQQRVRRLVLGLQEDPTASCQGVLVQMTTADLARLRAREAAYDERDVTDSIDRPPGRVVTFVPKQDRIRGGVGVPEPLVIERSYIDVCVSGASEHGLKAAVAEVQDTGDVEVVDDPTEIQYSWPPR